MKDCWKRMKRVSCELFSMKLHIFGFTTSHLRLLRIHLGIWMRNRKSKQTTVWVSDSRVTGEAMLKGHATRGEVKLIYNLMS